MPRSRYLLSLFSFFSLLLLLVACRPSEEPLESPPSLVVIGVDGATWDVIDPMMARGELPNFQSLVERGARSSLITLPPLVSPVAWTTYATGTFSRKHWILDFTYPYTDAEKHPVESTRRREPAIWNAATEHGRRVGVVGYYVTHPAEVVNGFMVSDKILQAQPGSTFPPELKDEVELVKGLARVRLFKRFMPWGYHSGDADDPESPYQNVSRIVRGRIDGAIIRDENVRRTALKLLDRPVDLFITYLRLVDHAEHSTWLYFDPSDFDTLPDPADVERLGGMIPEAYRYTDEFLGDVLTKVGDDVNVVVVSDHGHGSATGHFEIRVPELADRLSGNHRFNGILLAAGPDIRPGTYEGINSLDVTPLLLALGRVPISRQLPGHLPEEILIPEILAGAGPPTVKAYSKIWESVDSAPGDRESDAQTLAELKALGYIDASTETGGRGDAPTADFWSIAPSLRQNALLGEMLYYLLEDDVDRATRLMAAIEENDAALARRMPAILMNHTQVMSEDFSQELFSDHTLDEFFSAYPVAGRP